MESVANLDPGQATPDVIAAIDRVIENARGSKARLQSAYDDAYGDLESAGGSQADNDPLGIHQ